MGTFRSRFRIIVAVSGIAAAIAVVLYARAVARVVPPPLGTPLETAADGLSLVAALYAVNWVLAWVYRASWPVTLVRCLVFAVVAYVGLSSLVDVFGEHRGLAWQILGVEDASDAQLVAALRAQAICDAVVLGLSAICIGFGFERGRDGEGAEPDGEGEDDESDDASAENGDR